MLNVHEACIKGGFCAVCPEPVCIFPHCPRNICCTQLSASKCSWAAICNRTAFQVIAPLCVVSAYRSRRIHPDHVYRLSRSFPKQRVNLVRDLVMSLLLPRGILFSFWPQVCVLFANVSHATKVPRVFEKDFDFLMSHFRLLLGSKSFRTTSSANCSGPGFLVLSG